MSSPDDFYVTLKNTFDLLYAEGATHPKMMNIGLHCRIVGRPSRAVALRQFLAYARGFPDVWFAKRIETAGREAKIDVVEIARVLIQLNQLSEDEVKTMLATRRNQQ